MKMKFKLLVWGLLVTVGVCLSACGGGKDGGGNASNNADSLQKALEMKTRQYDDLSMFMNTISQSLDSIAYAENMLMMAASPENGAVSRDAIKMRVMQFGQIIERQKQRIAALSDSLASHKDSGVSAEQITRLNGIIAFMNTQLDAKEKELQQLQAQLASSKTTVTQLTQSVTSLKSNVSTLKQDVAKLETKNEKLDEALTTQDQVINEGYIKIGTKKELEAAGVLTKGGLFKKRKVNYSGFSGGGFQRVDIRHATSIPISGKKAKLLTAAPAGSYTLSQVQKGQWVLTITNPTQFWSVSNYCVIQTD